MHSTPNPKQTDPRDIVLVAPEDKELSNLAHEAMRYSSDPQTRMGSDFSAGPPIPPVDTTFRPAAVNNVEVPSDRPSIGRRAVRAFIRFLWVACIGGAGVAWQFYGDAAKRSIASWAPQLVLTLSRPLENPGPPEQPSPPTVPAADANAAPPQPAAPGQTAPEAVAPAAAASAESAQLLPPIARDLASVGQEVEQLKASIEHLKASQRQMSRDIARVSEQNLRPKVSALPPRPAAARAHKPIAPYPPPQPTSAATLPQAAAPYYAPRQPEPQPQAAAQPTQAEPELSSVPRPPMPVR
jgi:hypothetical protein